MESIEAGDLGVHLAVHGQLSFLCLVKYDLRWFSYGWHATSTLIRLHDRHD